MSALDTPSLGEPVLPSSSEQQIVLILVGLVGSGKSTFAQALEDHYPRFRRCNQDDLGDRKRVESLARQSLRQGLSVCIDRTNFNAPQRSYWINIAREIPGTAIHVIVFDTPYEVCANRLRERTGHPTIKTPQEGLSVLSRFASEFELPTPEEGYNRIIRLRPSDHPSMTYTYADIASILQRLHDSAPVVSSGSRNSTFNRGPYFREGNHRGRFNVRMHTHGHSHNPNRPMNDVGRRPFAHDHGSPSGSFSTFRGTIFVPEEPGRRKNIAGPSDGSTSASQSTSNWRGSGSSEDPITL